MLFLTSNGLCGYDVKRSIISWVVFQPGLSLFSNLRSCFAYDANKGNWHLKFTLMSHYFITILVILFDPETGLLSENELKFEKNQSKVVCTGRPGNLHFTGIAANV
jgi:hypothetical protein